MHIEFKGQENPPREVSEGGGMSEMLLLVEQHRIGQMLTSYI